MTWLQDMLPPPEKIDAWQGSVMEFKNKFKDFEIDPKYTELGRSRINSLKEWLDERLDQAIKATEEEENSPNEAVIVQQAEPGKASNILQRMSAGKIQCKLMSHITSHF